MNREIRARIPEPMWSLIERDVQRTGLTQSAILRAIVYHHFSRRIADKNNDLEQAFQATSGTD